MFENVTVIIIKRDEVVISDFKFLNLKTERIEKETNINKYITIDAANITSESPSSNSLNIAINISVKIAKVNVINFI